MTEQDSNLLARLGDDVRTGADRSVRAMRNGLRQYARVNRPPMASTPKDTVWQRDKVQLWRYRSDTRSDGPPLLLVHSLVNRSYIFDLVPGNSVIEVLLARGLDVYLIDWGIPDAADAENTLETYCADYLPEIVRSVASHSESSKVDLLGYCFGGVLALLYAAAHPNDPINSLTCLATPIDDTKMPGPLRSTSENVVDLSVMIDDTGNVPGEVIANAMRALAPTAELSSMVNLAANLWNDDYVAAHNAIDMWGKDQIPFAGSAFRQYAKQFAATNSFMTDQLELAGKPISLADIEVPFLNVYGTKDHIVPADASRPLSSLVGSADVSDLELDAGHVGLFVGRRAHKHGVPAIIDWIESRR